MKNKYTDTFIAWSPVCLRCKMTCLWWPALEKKPIFGHLWTGKSASTGKRKKLGEKAFPSFFQHFFLFLSFFGVVFFTRQLSWSFLLMQNIGYIFSFKQTRLGPEKNLKPRRLLKKKEPVWALLSGIISCRMIFVSFGFGFTFGNHLL